MKKTLSPKFVIIIVVFLCTAITSCTSQSSEYAARKDPSITYSNYRLDNGQLLLGNSNYPAISYSGDRTVNRTTENSPSVKDIKEDIKLLSALGIKLLRTYNTNEFPQATNLLKAIRELKKEDPDFEMYVMAGAWIQCHGAFKDDVPTDHTKEHYEWNKDEIDAAIAQAKAYPDIVKIIAVGNEAMVTWQAHFVSPSIILKWVNYLKDARASGDMPANTLVTTSDNWAALGGEASYHNDDLLALLKAIDFVSLHTYAYHDTHYGHDFWVIPDQEKGLSLQEQSKFAIKRAIARQKDQYNLVKNYLKQNNIKKAIHIGETGWSTLDNGFYSDGGTCAADEYKTKLFHDAVRAWTKKDNLSCFYFEGFDEPWKSGGTDGSEGHFGLFTVDGKAKYSIWDLVDAGAFSGVNRGGNPIDKTYGGVEADLLKNVKAPD